MSKKFFQLLTFSGLSIIVLTAMKAATFAAEDTDCKIQQEKCNITGCERLEEKAAIEKCKSLGWSPVAKTTVNHEACWQGCLMDQEIGKKFEQPTELIKDSQTGQNVLVVPKGKLQKGCHHTPCVPPKPRKGPGGL